MKYGAKREALDEALPAVPIAEEPETWRNTNRGNCSLRVKHSSTETGS